MLWSLSVCGNDWQISEKLTRLCTIPEPAMFSGTWDRTSYAMEARILRPLLWFGLLEHRSEKSQAAGSASIIFIARLPCSIDCSDSMSKWNLRRSPVIKRNILLPSSAVSGHHGHGPQG